MMAILFWLCVGLIIYSYIGYPILLTLISRIKPPYLASLIDTEFPSVTLLIAAYNEESVIEEKIVNSLELDYPKDKLQILIVTDGSDDDTPEIVRNYEDQQVELSHIPERNGKMAAINRAISQVRGDFIVFSDANNIFDDKVIRYLIAPFKDSDVGAVTGAKHILQDKRNLSASEGLYWRYESFIKIQETRLGCVIGAPGEIFAVRRELFQLPPSNIINDDFYIAMSIIKRGYNILYIPQARSFEYVSATAQDEMTRRSRIVAGRYQFLLQAYKLIPYNRIKIVWQVISHKFLRPLIPFFMIVALATNLILVLSPSTTSRNALLGLQLPFNWIFLILQISFYGVAFLGNYVKLNGKLGKLFYIPSFLVNSNFATLIGLYRYMMNRQSHVWKRVERYKDTR